VRVHVDTMKYGATDTKPTTVEDQVKKRDCGKGCQDFQFSTLVLVAVLCAASIAEGYDLGVVNGAIVQIQEHFHFSSHEVGLVVAITPAFCIVGALLHGALADHFGRRLGLVSAVSFLFAGPLVMASTSGLTGLLVGRMLVGIGIGAGMLVVTIYVAELVPASQRGRLVACQEVALNVGICLGFLMGWLLLGTTDDWRWMLLVGSILPLPLIVVLFTVYLTGADDNALLAETPRWLAKQKRWDSAHRVLKRYQGTDDAETSRLLDDLRQECEQEGGEEFVSWSSLLCAWGDRPLLRMLAAGILVAVGEMVCGGTSIAYYSNTIMQEDLGKSAAFFSTMIMGFIRLVGVTAATLCVDDLGRRTLLLTSASVMTVACIWIGITAAHSEKFGNWMLPAGLWLMMLGFVMGLGTVSLVYISEIFPTRMRQKGMVICMFWCRLGGASCAMAYPLLIDHYGISITFFLQAGINCILLSLIWLMVIETKGLPLEEAHKLFDHKQP